MGNCSRVRRATTTAIAGRRRAQHLSSRLGAALREARAATGMTQRQAATRCGLSQSRFSQLEAGLGAGASIETWAIAAASVGESLAAFLERLPGADRPRDLEHLKRQSAIVELARTGGWRAMPEYAIDAGPRSRSIDVVLTRASTREAIVVEVWDWLDDVGAAWRGLDGKVLALPQQLQPAGAWRVVGLFVLRHTRRNRALVHELAPLFRARFGAGGQRWIRTLRESEVAAPSGSGLLWTTADGRLTVPRLHR